MIVISYQISLLEPVLVTILDGEPNSKESLNYLPGTALRGAVIAAWMRDKRNAAARDDAAADAAARTLFFNGKTRFLNGYPVQRDTDKRSLPTPRSWHTKKGETDVFHDFAHPDFVLDKEAQWARSNAPFRSRYDGSGDTTQSLKPDVQVMVHTTRSRIKGRATPDEGDLFRYIALEAGQTFKAYVLLDEDAGTPDAESSAPDSHKLRQDIEKYLPSISRLGGSRNAGYGRVSVSKVTVENSAISAAWREYDYDLPSSTPAGSEAPAQAGTQAAVILLSDALLRDDWGQYSVDMEVMEAALADKLSGATIMSGAANNRAAYMEETVIGGFNQKWGLPLAQQQAFAMGSVFLITLPSVDTVAIAKLEAEGIGERRAEGFGRVGVCALPQKEWKSDTGEIAKDYASAPLSSDGKNVLRDMATRMVRSELDRLVLANVQTLQIKNAPSGSQLSRLRGVVQKKLGEVISTQDQEQGTPVSLNDVMTFLDGMRDRAKDQYRAAKIDIIDPQILFSWLKDQLQEAENYQERGVNKTKVGGEESALTTEGRLKPIVSQEYALRLIDGVLAHAAKEKK